MVVGVSWAFVAYDDVEYLYFVFILNVLLVQQQNWKFRKQIFLENVGVVRYELCSCLFRRLPFDLCVCQLAR